MRDSSEMLVYPSFLKGANQLHGRVVRLRGLNITKRNAVSLWRQQTIVNGKVSVIVITEPYKSVNASSL